MSTDYQQEYLALCRHLSKLYNQTVDLTSILFLVGMQEYGQLARSFDKDIKLNLIKLGACKLLSIKAYYSYQGCDQSGWPVYSRVPDRPPLQEKQQDEILKQAAIIYFDKTFNSFK